MRMPLLKHALHLHIIQSSNSTSQLSTIPSRESNVKTHICPGCLVMPWWLDRVAYSPLTSVSLSTAARRRTRHIHAHPRGKQAPPRHMHTHTCTYMIHLTRHTSLSRLPARSSNLNVFSSLFTPKKPASADRYAMRSLATSFACAPVSCLTGPARTDG